MGVVYDKQRNKFRAVYYENGKAVHVGRFDTKLKATRALNKARELKSLTNDDELQAKIDNLSFETPLNPNRFYGKGEYVKFRQDYVAQKRSLAGRIKAIWQHIKQRK